MKGHKEHHHKAGGGKAMTGKAEWKEDLASKPERYTQGKPEGEAEEKKHGGRAKRKHGGHVHHEHGKHLGHAKHLGHIHGEKAMHHMGRKPRKAGGRAGADSMPFSSAHAGTAPKGHKDKDID